MKYVKLEDIVGLLNEYGFGYDFVMEKLATLPTKEDDWVNVIKGMIADRVEANKQGYIYYGLSDFKAIANDMQCLLNDIDNLPSPPTK